MLLSLVVLYYIAWRLLVCDTECIPVSVSLQSLETELGGQKKEHEEEIEQLQREHENKILFMLKQMQSKNPVSASGTENVTDKEVKSRLKFQVGIENSIVFSCVISRHLFL